MKIRDWSKEIQQGAFVSKKPTYNVGEYFKFYKELLQKP